LNGKVERSQQTDLIEFWAVADFESARLREELDEWQMFYNWHRGHGAHGGRTPMERCCELLEQTPLSDDVAGCYDGSQERDRTRNYQDDLRLAAVWKSMRENPPSR
jgi:hypothetical protein